MNNAKEKAVELVNKFKKYAYYPKTDDDEIFIKYINKNAKHCALIAVDEIIKHIKRRVVQLHDATDICDLKEWQEVKSEIEKL